MGTYTGTEDWDKIWPGEISDGATADPAGTTPGAGPDTLIGNGGNDSLGGGNGSDQIFGGEGDDYIGGERGDDQIFGGEGSDFLDGESGDDAMEGGAGDDTYGVEDPGDAVIEDTTDASGGVDLVIVSFSYTLGFGLENLSMSGLNIEEDLNGTGNILNNTLSGNDGSNVLKGFRGDDLLRGYGADDKLLGAKGNDVLNGGKGEDRLRGGAGDDEFVFLRPSQGGDIITDFTDTSGNKDRIAIDALHFKGGLEAGGHLTRAQFQISESHEAQDAKVRCIFDTRDQTLWFDRNGDKAGGLSLVADLQASAQVGHDDIWLI